MRLAILAYHKIGEPPAGGWRTWFYIPEETLVAQLGYLKENGWEVIGADDFLRGLREPESLPERSALLTFDDGYRSMLAVALPVLAGFGYPSVLFVPTGFVGGTNAFEGGAEPEEPLCGWDDLRDLERGGVSVQSHGVSHRAFSTLDAGDQAEELVRSRTVLEDNLEKPVSLFAYPYGDGGPETTGEAARRVGYRAAFLYKGGVARLGEHDPYRLPRVAMGPTTDLGSKLDGGT